MIINLTQLTKKVGWKPNRYFFVRKAFEGFEQQLTKEEVKALVKALDTEYKEAINTLKNHVTK